MKLLRDALPDQTVDHRRDVPDDAFRRLAADRTPGSRSTDAIGTSPDTRPADGVTATTGSRAKSMMTRPMVAFQKPITSHGKVTA